MTLQDDFLRKAAVLIATLDDQAAETLLEQIGRDQAVLLRRMLGELAPITLDERSTVIQEFLQSGAAGPLSVGDSDAVEVDDSLAAKIAAAEPSEETLEEMLEETPSEMPEDSPFSFLAGATPQILADLLAGEHAQTISVVLSYLPPAKASEVLRCLPDDRQSDVLQRLGRLQETDESVVAEVEQELQRLFQRRIHVRQNPPVGLATVCAMLDAADDAERLRIMQQLERHAPEILAEIDAGVMNRSTRRIAPVTSSSTQRDGTSRGSSAAAGPVSDGCEKDGIQPDRRGSVPASSAGAAAGPQVAFEFDDLAALDDAALALVFRRSDPEVALVALAAAGPGLLDRIQRQLPWREARELKFQIGRLGPIRLSDVERAQQRLAGVAVTLIQQGVIPPPKNRRFIIAA